jgi:hypothetical protein
MLSSLAALVVRLAAIRWAFKTLIGAAVLLPVVTILKVVGLPILGILGVVAMPVLFVLFLFGLPVFLVLIVGALILAGVAMLLTLGMFALKFFLFVVLPVWLVWKLVGFLWRVMRPRPDADLAGSQS